MDNPAPSGTSAAAVKLDYANPALFSGRLVRLLSYGNEEDARVHAAALWNEGIPSQVVNAHTNALGIPYAGFSPVELHVLEGDVPRAREILAGPYREDLEPAGDEVAEAPLDENGQPFALEIVGAFPSVRALFDMQMVLASANLPCYLPVLVSRGDGPPGRGDRFLLRVVADDLPRARQLIAQEAADDAADAAEGEAADPRCPVCGSWRVFDQPHFWKSLAAALRLGSKVEPRMICLACQYRGPADEFGKG